METYQTEEQQVEAIKKFWQENGNFIIGGILVGLGSFVGFNYYKDSKLESEEAATSAYIEMMESVQEHSDNFVEEGEAFIQANKETSFASFTSLALAKDAVSHQDWAGAEKHLQMAIDNAADEGVKSIAILRLARVQLQQAQADKALATLANDMAEGFVGAAEEVKGDAYLMQGKNELARNAYQAAIDALGAAAANNQSLQMKLDDLAQHVELTTLPEISK
ncbi:tetratricopeptide repeat protein [Thalassotalea sp. LPB0316]|uniref:YfgM family protein n=1 Tax=Thalassotalea sp. LPB0316 TaxID=2769490 RepID=UPI001865AA20|nr:tetratricopeptide repeat protein [Thalassotalea sp. LPB0316]QOL26980.1 tetratricopeptide repeat protein [Thalassotalea sp. LPB0316]